MAKKRGRKHSVTNVKIRAILKKQGKDALENYIPLILGRSYSNFSTSLKQGVLTIWEYLAISHDLGTTEWLPDYKVYENVIKNKINHNRQKRELIPVQKAKEISKRKKERLQFVADKTGQPGQSLAEIVAKRKKGV